MNRPRRSQEQRREMKRVVQARYRERHRTELNAKQRARYWGDLEKTRRRQNHSNRRQYWKNRERLLAANARYRQANRDRLRAKQREWRNRNLKQQRARDRQRSLQRYRSGGKSAYMKAWRLRNPEKARGFLRASFHRRRVLSHGESFTAKQWTQLLGEYGNACAYCGASGPLTADHRVPLSRGGRNVIGNIVPACKSCNSRKHTMTEEEFRALLSQQSNRLAEGYFEYAALGMEGRSGSITYSLS